MTTKLEQALATIRAAIAQGECATLDAHWVSEEELPSFNAWLNLFVESRIMEDRAARAQEQAEQEPVASSIRGFSLWLDREAWGHVIDGLMLERERSAQRKAANPDSNSNYIANRCAELIAQIGEAATDIVQPVSQEPVAIADGTFNHNCPLGTPLYAAPVRTKDLTDFEIDCIRFNLESGKTWIDFARAVIAKYKEKNK